MWRRRQKVTLVVFKLRVGRNSVQLSGSVLMSIESDTGYKVGRGRD